jgi:hypothetical protein
MTRDSLRGSFVVPSWFSACVYILRLLYKNNAARNEARTHTNADGACIVLVARKRRQERCTSSWG